MANGNRRIPRADDALNTFICNTTKKLIAPELPNNWERLGMTEAQKDAWKALHDEWVAAYSRCTSNTLRTNPAISVKNEVRKRFTKFSSSILAKAQTLSTITEDDRVLFRIPKRKKTYTRRAAIEGSPMLQISNMAGGWLKLRARVVGSEGRARIHKLANGMEIRYALLAPGSAPPQTWSECLESAFTTKAISILELSSEHRGKVCYLFCRWINSSELSKSGPWTNRMEAIVA